MSSSRPLHVLNAGALALALVVFGTVMGGALKLGAWGTAPPERRA